MKNRIKIAFFILTLINIMLFTFNIKPVSAVTMDDIRAEIKCPDHDRPEIVSLVERLIIEGKTEQEILDAVGDQFGLEVLVNPRPEKIGVLPFLIPALGIAIALIFVFAYIKRWISRGKKIYQEEKDVVNASIDLADYDKRFEEEYERFKKEE